MAKRQMDFTLTIGSEWVEGEMLPVGGEMCTRTIEFETDGTKPFDDARNALESEMGNESYHIWYWTMRD